MSKNLGPDSSYLSKVAQFEREKQQRREMRRKAAKKKAKDKENIRKQRHIAKRLPTPVTILGAGGGDSEKWNPKLQRWEKVIELTFENVVHLKNLMEEATSKGIPLNEFQQACVDAGIPQDVVEDLTIVKI